MPTPDEELSADDIEASEAPHEFPMENMIPTSASEDLRRLEEKTIKATHLLQIHVSPSQATGPHTRE